MRIFYDKCGLPIHLQSISGEDSFAGIIEGSPWIIQRHRYLKGCEINEQKKGVYVYGLDEIKQQIDTNDKHTDIWPPQERWTANLHAYLNTRVNGRYSLKLKWYQNQKDPFEYMALILSSIDFMSHAIFVEEMDED